jgi:pimeloyl-ACP methyl ester carboxylesterase
MSARSAGSAPTLVLVHGAGNTSRVWSKVQQRLEHRSLAIDLPGRRNRPGDITRVTIDEAADVAARDVEEQTTGPLILVGHSAGGIVLPALTARLGDRVEHLVFVAGLCARDGEGVIDTVRPEHKDEMAARLEEMRVRFDGHMLDPVPRDAASGLVIDSRTAMGIESLNFMGQPVSWQGVPDAVGRTFVRCLRDRIQPRAMQARLAENCGATTVLDLDSGHTPALTAPDRLAVLLDAIGVSVSERPIV